MKINKLIAKGLSIGLLLNSLSILSYANVEIPNRYQTLEGEYITIDDSTEGNLEEIEIFGNTVQNPNNLEDIQSVGDLYVDKEGNPILDKQGRKQYKIGLKSSNANLLDINNVVQGVNNYGTEGETPILSSSELRLTIKVENAIPILPNTKITCQSSKFYFAIAELSNGITSGDTGWTTGKKTIVTKSTTTHIALNIASGRTIGESHRITIDDIQNGDIMIYYGDKDMENIEFSSNNIDILLPTQLQKIGNVADRLYWDSSKMRYVIEKNIKTFVNKTEIEYSDILDEEFAWRIYSKKLIGFDDCRETYGGGLNNPAIFSKNIKTVSYAESLSGNNYGICFGTNSICANISKSMYKTKGEVIEMFANLKIVYILREPVVIETNITSKLKIPAYKDRTHLYVETENGINPTLKVTVDRLAKVSEELVVEVELNPTQFNLSRARFMVNQMPESLLKDQLQARLSDIFEIEGMKMEKLSFTSNVDLYIKSENLLQISIDTNMVSFDDFSGVEDLEKQNAVNITVNSSLPYQLNSYLVSEIQNSDKSKIMDKDILNIRENSEGEYKTFNNINEKLVLKDNIAQGNDNVHNIDLMFKSGLAFDKDVYKATIKFEAEQK